MNDDELNEGPAEPIDDVDTGEPLAELRELAEEPEPGFLARIRNNIQRRVLTSQLLDLSWLTPVIVLVEYLKLAFGFFERETSKEGDAE